MSSPHYEVVVREEPPFVMVPPKTGGGNGTFTGLAIDLLTMVAEKALFKYHIRLADHHVSYVYQDHQGKWQGLLNELVSNSDLAVGPIPIMKHSTLDFVEFSKPFMTSGISLLIKYPPPTTRGINLMLQPFAAEVWVMLCLAFIVISLALFLIGRFSPYEWAHVSKEKDPRLARTDFSIKNSFLFAASTLSWQGYRELPRSISGRILTCMWFMFTVFVVVAYTACLCAILTIRHEATPQRLPFSGIEDIVESRVKLGAMKYEHVYTTLKFGIQTHNALFSKLYTYIEDSQEWIQKRNEGAQRVKDLGGSYALLMETVKADYITATNCDLITYGETLTTFGYGLATPKNSPVMDRINLAITELHENGDLDKLISKYFHERQWCPKYDKSKLVPQKAGTMSNFNTVSSMDMKDMAIPFLFLFLGVLGAAGALAVEIYYKTRILTRLNSKDNKVRLPLNTESGISKAPKTSPPPPPIYKVTNKLQEVDTTDKHKKQLAASPDNIDDKDVEKSLHSIELESLDDKVEAVGDDDAIKHEMDGGEMEMVNSIKVSTEFINEIS